MKYRRLGRTGLKVSTIGVGTWQFGGEWGREFSGSEVTAILGRARELGINLLDTAECYGDHISESLIGDAISEHRAEWIVATKFGHLSCGSMLRADRWSPSDVVRQLDASLRALQTDYIDIYQFHSGSDTAFFQDELWTVLDRQVAAGKIRFLGISLGFPYSPLQIQAASRLHASVIQVRYNYLERLAEKEILPHCQAQDFGVLARVPLASGLLTGKYRPNDSFPQNDHRSKIPAAEWEGRRAEVEHLRAAKIPAGLPMAQWALAWALQNPAVTCTIAGCKNLHHVEVNAAAAHVITDDHPQTWKVLADPMY